MHKILPLSIASAKGREPLSVVVLKIIDPDGFLVVENECKESYQCHWLEGGTPPRLEMGDRLLMAHIPGLDRPVVVGKIGVYNPATVLIAAGKSLSLQCGESSIDLQADGKVLIKGEDVLIRAKGTQRIRAGTVSIN